MFDIVQQLPIIKLNPIPPMQPAPQSRWSATLAATCAATCAFLQAFWPALITPVLICVSLNTGHPFLGVLGFACMAAAKRLWWTCIFGLLNAMAILAGFLVCIIPAVRSLFHG